MLQVFHPDQIYRAVRVILRAGALANNRRALRQRQVRMRAQNNTLQLADAVYVLHRIFRGVPVTCHLMPNADRRCRNTP